MHFAHGNGFPSPCYRQLLDRLALRFDCCYIDKIGHSPVFPVTENWHSLVDELIDSVKTQSQQAVIAVGHSLGGVLSVLAAIEQPSLFKAVILLDSPLLGRFKSLVVWLAKQMDFIDRLTPAYHTRARKEHWATREKALVYLRSRALFKTFSEVCLNDYIDFGMLRDGQGYTLRFDPEIEYQIYCTIPHHLMRYEGCLSVPTTLIYGDASRVVDRLDRRYMKKKYAISSIETQGTHMFPMENPETIADLIVKLVENLKGE